MTLKTLGALALTLFACAPAFAQETSTTATTSTTDSAAPHAVWIDTGFATYHFESDKQLNGRNPGVGLEYRFTDSVAVTAGRFFNSDLQHSRYVGLYYQPWTVAGIKLGAVVGGFDGYPKMHDGAWFFAAIPTATFEYQRFGINVAAVPTYKNRLHGGISVQLKFKLWE